MRREAFSLVELSIVLVILGLLVGGILAGQSLIRASELRSVTAEQQRWLTATHAFRNKYFGLPGDILNATSFWGSMSNCAAASPSGSGTQTCNGNGDGVISSAASASETGERFGFWQHLANAGLIEGTYSGIAGPGRHDNALPGNNTPSSRIASTAVWDASQWSAGGSSFMFRQPAANHILILGGSSVNWNNGAILSTDETWNIDTKMDDGHASRGNVWAVRWDDCTPASANNDYQNYDLAATGLRCGIAFRNAF